MKKILAISAAFLAFAPIAFAGNLGTLNESVMVGKTVTVALNPSSTGRWFLPSLSNTNPNVAIASTNGNNLVLQGRSVGTAAVKVCSEIQNVNCLDVTITVTGNVLGESTNAHPSGTWVIDNGTVYYITDSGIIPISTWKIFLSNSAGKKVTFTPASSDDLKLPLLPLMTLSDSRVK